MLLVRTVGDGVIVSTRSGEKSAGVGRRGGAIAYVDVVG